MALIKKKKKIKTYCWGTIFTNATYSNPISSYKLTKKYPNILYKLFWAKIIIFISLPKLGYNINHHKKFQSLISYLISLFSKAQHWPYEPNTYISFYSNSCPKNHAWQYLYQSPRWSMLGIIYIKAQDEPYLTIYISKDQDDLCTWQYICRSPRRFMLGNIHIKAQDNLCLTIFITKPKIITWKNQKRKMTPW